MKLLAWPLRLLPRPPLTPDAVDFVNQPAVVDTGPLLESLPRRLTPFEEALAADANEAVSLVRLADIAWAARDDERALEPGDQPKLLLNRCPKHDLFSPRANR